MMVSLLVQFTKGIKFVEKIPTQLWSYIMALLVIVPARAFTAGLILDADNIGLLLYNGVIVSLGSNGGFHFAQKVGGKIKDGKLLIDTSDPNKEIYKIDVGSIDELCNKKTITLSVEPGQDLSHQ